MSSALGVLLLASGAAAQEEPEAKPTEEEIPRPRIMLEPGDVVDVADAFDDDDIYDAWITLKFQYMSKRTRIMRESTLFEPGLTTGGYTSRNMVVGQYIENTSRLTPRVDLGLYQDFALYARLPIVLTNERKIESLDGSAGSAATILAGAPGEQLFTVPFEAPDRSGVEYVALGLDGNILNQARDPTKPTWLMGAEVRISAGEPMHACNGNPADGQVSCAHPSDVNRNGESDDSLVDAEGNKLEGADADERDAGITRGTVGLEIHTIMSKRIKYVEPYAGFKALFEFLQGESDYDDTDLEGTLTNHPPLVGTVIVGMMFHPWENRERFHRLSFDLRFEGDYRSEGRDYSELFDALGSSSVSSLRNPRWARYQDACPGESCDPKSVVAQGSQKTYFTGLTTVEAYGSYRLSTSVTWQPSEYFKLNVGFGYRFDQAHGISHDQPCNPDFKDDIGESGPCHVQNGSSYRATGIPNPAYRATINQVGRRFYVDDSHMFELFTKGVLMF